MTDSTDDDRSGDESADADAPVPDDVYEGMAPLEPYTAGELASMLDVPRDRLRRLLARLATDDRVRKKAPEPDRTIWIREPPADTCANFGKAFQVKCLHPVFSSVQFCPRCGTQLD